MMAPHWLDDVFENPQNAPAALTLNSRFKEAIAKAQAAYYEAEAFHKKNPRAVGGSPAQSARTAFLEAVNAD